MEKLNHLEEYNYLILNSQWWSNLRILVKNDNQSNFIAIILAIRICSFLAILTSFRTNLYCLLFVNGKSHRLSKHIVLQCNAYTTQIILKNESM